LILEKLEKGLSRQRIWQDLHFDRGGEMGYESVKRFVRSLGPGRELPYRRLECGAGEEVEVDFGTGAPVVNERGRHRTKVLRTVLSYSRKGHSESNFHEGTEEFIRCLEDAFWSWGGVPRVVKVDNPKSIVKHADWYDPELNPRVQSFCEHYGVVILPTKPRTPRHKGKVERGVGYVKDNALKGREFGSLSVQNEFLDSWERNVADKRIHGTTRKQVGKVFEEEERAALLPLPPDRFPFFHEGRRKVHRDGHVEVAKAYYSVPPEYLGKRLWVRWDARVVRIFDSRMNQVTIHARKEAGQFSTDRSHIAPEKISAVEAGPAPLLKKIAFVGTHASRWAREVIAQRGVIGTRVLMGLLSLTGKYQAKEIEEACRLAITHGAWRLRSVRELLKHSNDQEQKQIEFLEEHELIRNMSEYGELVKNL
jgi:transposase